MSMFTMPGRMPSLRGSCPIPRCVCASRVGAALAGDWLMIAVAFAVAIAFAHPLVYALAAIVIARSQLALAVMMHEAAHGLLARNRRVNDALGQLFAAGRCGCRCGRIVPAI